MSSKPSINEIVLAVMIFGIPLTVNLGNIVLIIAFLFSLYQLSVNFKSAGVVKTDFSLIFPVIFFSLVLISAVLSRDSHAGFIQVEKNLLMLVIPITLHLLCKNNKIDYIFLLKVFVLSNMVATLILLSAGCLRMFHGGTSEVFFFHEFTSFLDLHPVYVALNISLVIFFITQYYLIKAIQSKKKFFTLIAILVYFNIILFLCASKGVILFFTILYVIQLWFIFNKMKFRLIAYSMVLIVSFSLLGIPQVSKRFFNGLHFDISNFQPTHQIEKAKVFSNKEKEKISDLELRYLMFKIGTYHIFHENRYLWGYGIGDVQKYTDYHYMIYGLAPGWFEGYNLHNQYLQYFVSYGLFGTLLFLVYLGYSFTIAVKGKNKLHLLFLILIVSVFIFESLLSRNKGIVVFYFFNTLFLIKEINENWHFRNTGYSK